MALLGSDSSVTGPFPKGVLLLETLTGWEMLGQPYRFELGLLSPDPSFDADVLLGKPLAVGIRLGTGAFRYFHGIVTAIDAVHVALAAAHGTDFLLTWNCAHIANAAVRPRIESVCVRHGMRPPVHPSSAPQRSWRNRSSHDQGSDRRGSQGHPAENHHDLLAIFATLRRLEAKSKRPHVTLEPHKVPATRAADG